jgi:hypothetical protein
MKWIQKFKYYKKKNDLLKESKSNSYSTKSLISEICISMILLNNEFIDHILDKGMKARYSENSQIFLTDLKNLLLSKNRLQLGKFIDDKCQVDEEYSKITEVFNNIEFDIEKDWSILVNARITARNIIDKLLADEKLKPERIRKVYWLGPNKDKDYSEDIVIELNDGIQHSVYLNKNLSSQKSASFNKFAEDLIGNDIDKLFNEEYINRWNKLTQEWIRLIYENSKKNIQQHIEKFIDPNRIDNIDYFDYFDIKHTDSRFKHLGEFMKEFDRNILKLSDLLSEVWKNKESHFLDPDRITKEWHEIKIVILNSKILENLLTSSLKTNFTEDITKVEDEFKLAGGTIKMKLFKTLVDKMGCLERPIYFLGNNGNNFNLVPSREFFRKFYDDLDIKFDYHVKFKVDKEDLENNDFNIKLRLELDGNKLMDMNIIVYFSGGEMSGKLSAKYKFELSPNFNYLVSKKNTIDI